MSFSYRWAETGDVPAIKKFLKLQFGPESIQAAPERFESLFVRHPYGFHVALCCDDVEIVAVRCYLPFYLSSPKRFCGFPIDLMVTPEHRRKGISSCLMAMADERFELTVSSGQSPLQGEVYRKYGGHEVSVFYRALAVKKYTVGGPALKQQVRDLVSWGRWCLRCRKQGIIGRVAVPELDRYAEVISNRLAPHELGVVADVDLVDWRYFNPFYRDCRLVSVKVGNASGLIAYRKIGEEVQILDLFAPADQRCVILSGAVSALSAKYVSALFAGGSLAKLFKKAGFIIRPHAAKLMISGTGCSALNSSSKFEWLFFAGASDIALLDFPAGGE